MDPVTGFKSGFANVEPSVKSAVLSSFVAKIGKVLRAGAANVHAGALSHRLEALEHGDLLRAVRTLLPLGKRRNQPDGRAARLIGDRAQRRREEQREVGRRTESVSILFC